MDPKILASSGIYAITHTDSKRVYVGSAVKLSKRWRAHRGMLRKANHPSRFLQRAWTKYGEEAFDFSVLEVVDDPNTLIAREQFWIDRLCAADRPTGFNIRANAGSMLGFKHSEKSRNSMRKAKLGTTRIFSDAHRANLREALYRRFPNPPKWKKCAGCDNFVRDIRNKKYCSKACRAQCLNVTIICKSCLKAFSVYRSTSLQRDGSKCFCSRHCFYNFRKSSTELDRPLKQMDFGF